MGPYKIEVTAAAKAAREVPWAIYMAARAVDEKRIAELRSDVVGASRSGRPARYAPSVVMGVPLGHAVHHRQRRLGPVQRLDRHPTPAPPQRQRWTSPAQARMIRVPVNPPAL